MSDALDREQLVAHYNQALPVLRELGSIDAGKDALDALLVPGEDEGGVRPWYKNLPTEESEWDGIGRPYFARADAEEIPEEVADWDYPTIYSTINYQPLDADEGEPYKWDDGRTWETGRPLPEYGDIQRLALFADVDFAADEKTRPVDGDTRSLVEEALEEWVDAYADAAGTRDAVALLDSVGGTYVMVAPWAAAELLSWAHERLDDDERELLIEALADRWRDFNADVQEQVSESLPELDDVFELDGNTNKNRLFKAPLSIHKSLPGVVTPIDAEQPRFNFTHIDDVDKDVVENTREWCADFTAHVDADRREACVESLVDTLFPDALELQEDADDVLDGWRAALRNWAQTELTARETATEDALDATDLSKFDINADAVTLTSDSSVPFETAEALNVESVARDLGIISSSDRQKADEATRIEVNWRQSDSGDSAVVRSDNFTDLGDHSGGGAADLVAWTILGGDNTKPVGWDQDAAQIAAVFGKLRDLGFPIPVYVPERGSTYIDDGDERQRSRTPDWALAKVARLCDIAPESAITDGEITIPTLVNRTLAVLEEHDIDHGREPAQVHVDTDGRDAVAVEQGVEIDDDDDEHPTPDDDETWTERYSITERSYISDERSPFEIELPGCKDVVWAETRACDQRTAGYRYVTRDQDTGEITGYDPIINCDLELVSRLTHPDQPDLNEEWEIRINPTDPQEPTKTVISDPSAFNSPRTFRDEIKGESGSMRFAAVYGHKTVDALKTIVNAQDAPRRKAYARIKLLHEDGEPRLVTPEGTLGPDGWVEDPVHVWSRMDDGGVTDQWELAPAFDEFDSDRVADVAELIPQTRKHERFLPVLGYVFASTFRAPITETSATAVNKWNHIQGFGDTGAGKSSIGEVLWKMIGMSGDRLIKAKMTPHTSLETFSATNAVPLLMDEYKPTSWREHIANEFHENMRDASTGATQTKTWKYPLQKRYVIESSTVLLGEGRFPDDANALARRTIETTLSQQPGTPGTASYEAFKKLLTLTDSNNRSGMEHHALAWWQYALSAADNKLSLIEAWDDARDWGIDLLEQRGHDRDEELGRDMYRQAVQTVVFGVKMWRQFAEEMGARPEKLPTDEEIGDAIEYIIDRKNDDMAINRSDKDLFFELAARAASKTTTDNVGLKQQYLKGGEHYAFVHENNSTRPTELRIHLRSSVDEINRFARDYAIHEEVPQGRDVKSWLGDAAENPNDYALSKSTYHSSMGKRMIAVDWDMLRDELDVNMSDFRPLENASAVNEEASDGDDDDDGDSSNGDGDESAVPEDMPLADCEDGDQPTVTVQIDDVDHDTPPQMTAEARATDETVEGMRVVEWSGGGDDETVLEAGQHYRLDEVSIAEYDGSLEIHIQDTTTITEISEGVSLTPSPTAPGGEDLDGTVDDAVADGGDEVETDADEDRDTTDGDDGAIDESAGSDDPTLQELCARGVMYVRENHEGKVDGVGHDALIAHLIEFGAPEELAERAVEKLRNRGDLTVPAIGHYRV